MTSKAMLSVGILVTLYLIAGSGQATEPRTPATTRPQPTTATPTGGGAAAARAVASDPQPAPQPVAAEATVENPLFEPGTSPPVSPLNEDKSAVPASDGGKRIIEKGVGKPKPIR